MQSRVPVIVGGGGRKRTPAIAARTDAEFVARAEAIHTGPDDFRLINFAGSPAAVVGKIGRMRELGADRVYLQLIDVRDFDHVDLLASEELSQLG